LFHFSLICQITHVGSCSWPAVHFDPISRERLQTKYYNLHSPGNYGKYNNDIIKIVQKLFNLYPCSGEWQDQESHDTVWISN